MSDGYPKKIATEFMEPLRPDLIGVSLVKEPGVPLPIFYDQNGTPIIDSELAEKIADIVEENGSNIWFENNDEWWTDELGIDKSYSCCTDTLDVWIDSGLVISLYAIDTQN